MYKKGTCFCPTCQRNFPADRATYLAELLAGPKPVQIPLLLNSRSSRTEYAVSVGKMEYRHMGNEEITYDGALPSFIRLDISDAEGSVYRIAADRTTRVCPYCYTEGRTEYLPPFIGYRDCFLIALVGTKGSGKTAYASALMNSGCKDRLAALLGHNTEVIEECIDNRVAHHATEPGRIHFPASFQIRRRRRSFAVILADVSGLTFTRQKSGSNSPFQTNYFNMIQANADALLLMHDERDVRGLSSGEAGINAAGNLNTGLVGLSSRNMPCLCILSKSDLLQDFVRRQEGSILYKDQDPCVCANSEIFADMLVSANWKADLARHIAVSRQIFRECIRSAVTIENTTPCFLSSSGSGSADCLDTDHSYNVLMPVLYLLRNWL